MCVSKTSVTTHKVDYARFAVAAVWERRIRIIPMARSTLLSDLGGWFHEEISDFPTPRRGEKRDFPENLLRTSLNSALDHQPCPAPRFRGFV